MSKFTPSGRGNSFRSKRSSNDIAPGTLFGKKRISCLRCSKEFSISLLRKIPPNEPPEIPHIYACLNCLTDEEKLCQIKIMKEQ